MLKALTLAAVLLAAAPDDTPATRFLGLVAPDEPIFLGEGPTDGTRHPAGTGALNAIMLFAEFPDGERDKSMQELHEILVPPAVAFFEASSYGRLTLNVDVHFEWIPMRGRSTDPGYDCSKQAPHLNYIAEVAAAADPWVDFSAYDLIYVVANKAEGVFNSPTFNAGDGPGVRADGHEIRHAVTFGADIRGPNWGWQTLVHETGHVLGLPDLYSYGPRNGAYRNLHRFTGAWDPMGYQCRSRHFLAWHKYKLDWLDPTHFVIVHDGHATVELAHIETERGVKAVVLPVSPTEAYVAEVRHLSEEHPRPGVLLYRVSVTTRSGAGPVQVIPARPDDDAAHPDLARTYIALYDALFFAGDQFEDASTGVRLAVTAGADGKAFRVAVERQRSSTRLSR